MLKGNINEIDKLLPYVKESLQKALKYLQATDFSKLENGNYEIEGKAIYAGVNTYTTEPKADRKPEKHAKYIDVQFMGRGKESIYYATVRPDQVPSEDYLEERDVCFYKDVAEVNGADLVEGDFVILFPWEIHRPNCIFKEAECSEVQKIVVKVMAK